VLLIEDDPGDARLVRENLADALGAGTEILHRPSLGAALELLRGPEEIDLALLDLHLSDSAGAASVKKLGAARPEVPIVVVTHLDDLQAALACIDAGAQDYVSKSDVAPAALRRVVLHAIERHQLRREAERARSLDRELASTVQNAREAIVAFTPEGKVVTWNPAAVALYGTAARDALASTTDVLVPESQRAAFRTLLEKLVRGETLPLCEAIRRRADGTEIEVEENLFAIRDAAGNVARIASIARDTSELARLRRAAEILSGGGETTDEDETGSSAMKEALAQVQMVARDANATALLLGETGVGKGWTARRIHRLSPRAEKPFLEINCAGLSQQLVESELFGHERGAFTGAVGQKRGLVEAAEGGTLFLDEIGELPLPVQAQLLTFIDARTFRRVGGTRTLKADVRLIAATNVDLKEAAARGTFRRDLYYRLSVMPITVPPLRERADDLPALARTMLRDLSRRPGGRKVGLSREVATALGKYDWPGNVRELRNALERALILSHGEPIEVAHLPPEIRGGAGSRAVPASDKLEEVERAHILAILARVKGNRTHAAEILGIGRSTLKRKLAELREDPPDESGESEPLEDGD
jgi:PAS domain S-box-containing protein